MSCFVERREMGHPPGPNYATGERGTSLDYVAFHASVAPLPSARRAYTAIT
ncbi:MAG: hypothetical protein ABI895_21170 [Deltaproteobacteria bacterium]